MQGRAQHALGRNVQSCPSELTPRPGGVGLLRSWQRAAGRASPVLFGQLVAFHAPQPPQLGFAFFHLQQQTLVLLRHSERPSYTRGRRCGLSGRCRSESRHTPPAPAPQLRGQAGRTPWSWAGSASPRVVFGQREEGGRRAGRRVPLLHPRTRTGHRPGSLCTVRSRTSTALGAGKGLQRGLEVALTPPEKQRAALEALLLPRLPGRASTGRAGCLDLGNVCLKPAFQPFPAAGCAGKGREGKPCERRLQDPLRGLC